MKLPFGGGGSSDTKDDTNDDDEDWNNIFLFYHYYIIYSCHNLGLSMSLTSLLRSVKFGNVFTMPPSTTTVYPVK